MKLQLRGEDGNWRHYLDGRDVHCGDQLMLRVAARSPEIWVWARYEAHATRSGIGVILFTQFGRVIPDDETVLRWPKDGEI
jgi:hypothetical protein